MNMETVYSIVYFMDSLSAISFLYIAFAVLLIAATYVEDYRDGLWFYGIAGALPDKTIQPPPKEFWKSNPDNKYWHTIKPVEALLMWSCGFTGALYLIFGSLYFIKRSDLLTSVILFFINLLVTWLIRVQLHNKFLDYIRKYLRSRDI